MMRDDALAQGDEFLVAHVVLGVIGAPRADDEAPGAIGFEHMIDGGQEREALLVGGFAGLGLVVVVGADQRPIERLAGVEIMRAVIPDGLVNVGAILLAGEVPFREPLAIPLQMRRGLASEPAQVRSVVDFEVGADGVAASVGHIDLRDDVTEYQNSRRFELSIAANAFLNVVVFFSESESRNDDS